MATHAATAPTQSRAVRWMVIIAAVLVLIGMVAIVPTRSAHASGEGSGPVLAWNEITQNAAYVGRPPGGALYIEGVVAAAVYDTAVAIGGGYEPFISSPTLTAPVSAAAAIATAAHDVLVPYVDDVIGQVSYVDTQYSIAMAAIPDGPAKENAKHLGADVAADILAWREGDGFDDVVPYVQPTPGPGVFEPVAPTTPVDVKLSKVDPLTIKGIDQFRPDGPPALTSAQYTEDFNEVKRYGRIDSAVRTPAQTETALFWSENTAIQWPRTLRQIAVDHGLDLVGAARLFALTQVAGADGILSCFDAKYHYSFWRPVHAIQRADTDENPATIADANWKPLLTVNHPEYPSAHGCYTTAVTRGLAAFFGDDDIPFSMFSTVTSTTHRFDSFSDASWEMYDARVWAGLHFRNSTLVGGRIGRKVSRYIDRNFFEPV